MTISLDAGKRHLQDTPLTRQQIDELLRGEVERVRKGEPCQQSPSISSTSTTAFLARYFANTIKADPELASKLVLSHDTCINLPGDPRVSGEASLPLGANTFESPKIKSYRLVNGQGVLHLPEKDKRTTEKIFHIAEGGAPIPGYATAIPADVSARLVAAALNPGWRPGSQSDSLWEADRDSMVLPWVSNQGTYTNGEVKTMVSTVIRPMVKPPIPGISPAVYSEITVQAPAGFVSNLAFLEEVFATPQESVGMLKDISLSAKQFSGMTGSIIFAPHLLNLTKKELGLPYSNENEKYNDGKAFKLCIRDHTGNYVMLVADNYFGYGKKGVKDILSYQCNMLGQAQEFHAGGTIAYRREDLGIRYDASANRSSERTIQDILEKYGAKLSLRQDGKGAGHATHQDFPELVFVPHNAIFDKTKSLISWENNDGTISSLPLSTKKRYVLPDGYSITFESDEVTRAGSTSRVFKLIGCEPDGINFFKDATVSGGGKSELSKGFVNSQIRTMVSIANLSRAKEELRRLASLTWENRFLEPRNTLPESYSRSIFDQKRTLASVERLLTPSGDFSKSHNYLVQSIPDEIKRFIYLVKQLLPDGEELESFLSRFSVDKIDDHDSEYLLFDRKPLYQDCVRVGENVHTKETRWFVLRPDFAQSIKLPENDDIAVARYAYASEIDTLLGEKRSSLGELVLFTGNCEAKLFQRADDGHNEGADIPTERDFAQPGGFFTNYEPLPIRQAVEIEEDEQRLSLYSPPLRELIKQIASHARNHPDAKEYFVLPSHRRIVGGQPSANPRYLQTAVSESGRRDREIMGFLTLLSRGLQEEQPLLQPVEMEVPGRRLNRANPGEGIRSTAVLGPIGTQDTVEFVMDLSTSLTGKSPSTTGSVSIEGAKTKGPFNSMPGIIEIEDSLVASLLRGASARPFISVAGDIGENYKVGHDVTALMVELFNRLPPEERTVDYFIEKGWFEPVKDMTLKNAEGSIETIEASVLGYRLSKEGRARLLGTMFGQPEVVMPDDMLFPELQPGAQNAFIDGVRNIREAYKRIGQEHLDDGSAAEASLPLKALLHIMATGQFQSADGTAWDRNTPEFRALFTKEAMLGSDWYRERIEAQQQLDIRHWNNCRNIIQSKLRDSRACDDAQAAGINLQEELDYANAQFEHVSRAEYVKEIWGTPGVHPYRVKAYANAP